MVKLAHQIIHTKSPEYLYDILKQHISDNKANTRSQTGHKLGVKSADIGKSQWTKNIYCSRIFERYQKIQSIITYITEHKVFSKWLKCYL